MSSEALGLFLDVVVLIFLGAMIFYAIRLSKSLQEFRAQKGAFDGVIADLLSAIDQAERSIHGLKQASLVESEELGDLIRKAKLLSEELKDVNQASEGMASRLEGLAEKNRKIIQGGAQPQHAGSNPPEQKSYYAQLNQAKPEAISQMQVEPRRAQKTEFTKQDLPSFMIQDRDFEDLDALGERLDEAASNDTDTDMPVGLQSEAEKDLYNALRSSKKTLGGR